MSFPNRHHITMLLVLAGFAAAVAAFFGVVYLTLNR